MMLRTISAVVLAVVAAGYPSASAQTPSSWGEYSGVPHKYALASVKVLVIAAPEFNVQETIEMADCWKAWGARVEFAGPARTLTGESEPAAPGQAALPARELTVDRLLADVDGSRYDLVYIAGGEGIAGLLKTSRAELASILNAASRAGKTIASICHGPLALTASALVKGKRVTANGSADALKQAGAIWVNDIIVTDGRLITGQWPHLETFAVTVAEQLQYPAGNGPFARARAARPAIEQLFDGLRPAHIFEPKPVAMSEVEAALQAAMKTVGRPSRGGQTVRYVAISDPESKAGLERALSSQVTPEFAATVRANEQQLRAQIAAVLNRTPVLLLAFVNGQAPQTPAGDRIRRVDTMYAGAACGNFVLAARARGLGVAPLDLPQFLNAETEIKRLVQAPEGAVLVHIMGIGYPAVDGTPAPRRPASEVLSVGRWMTR